MGKNLKNIIEALIFASGEGVSFATLKQYFNAEYNDKQINRAIIDLKGEYCGDKGIHLIEFNNTYQMQSNPDYGAELADVLTPIKEKNLSKTLLEVLSIIAYRQPITKGEIEEARNGTSADYACAMLMKFNLITELGRRETSVGRPIEYGTTDEFLKKFGLTSLEDLPDYDELITKIKNNYDKYYKNSDGDNLFRAKEELGGDFFETEATAEHPDFIAEGEEVIVVDTDDNDDDGDDDAIFDNNFSD